MAVAVCPGSFDPFTLGHLDVVVRAAALFDEVVVGVGINSAKSPLLTVEERLDVARLATVHLRNVTVEPVPGLLARFCRDRGAVAIVKGLRGGSDVDAETPMALMNRHLTGIETVFVLGDPALAHVASSMVKDVARHGGSVSDLIPAGAVKILDAALLRERSARSRSADPGEHPENTEATR